MMNVKCTPGSLNFCPEEDVMVAGPAHWADQMTLESVAARPAPGDRARRIKAFLAEAQKVAA